MKVISLLPSATEIVCYVGATDWLVGRSHECDYPPPVRKLPMLTSAKNPFVDSQQMHDAVTETLQSGEGLYNLDTALLEQLQPDVIVTQSLCHVCSVDLCLVERFTSKMAKQPLVISLNPFSIEDVISDCRRVGKALGLEEQGERAAQQLEARLARCKQLVKELPPPLYSNVVMCEWTEPVFPGGHWTPQLVHIAGASHPLNPARDGGSAAPSKPVTNEALVASDPDLIILCPCGLDLAETRREAARIADKDWWLSMRAVQRGKVAEVDGNQMFNRPGPRLLDCLEWLVGLLRDRRDLMPQDFPWRWWHELQEAPAAEDKQEAAAAAAADVAAVQEPAGAQA